MKKSLLILTFFAISCSQVRHFKTDDTIAEYPKSNPNNIEVFSSKPDNKNYQILGEIVVAVDAGENSDKAIKLLVKEASKLGADAIIDLRLGFCEGFWESGIKGSATAIKFVK